MEREDIFSLALMINRDQCPPDNRMYYCTMGEDPECDCVMCWEKYLFWAVNGYRGDPYQLDRDKEVRGK